MNRKWILAAVIAGLVAFGTWYFASPAMALSGLKSAAENGDAEALKDHVDFVAFRESAKTQLKAQMAAEIAKPQSDEDPFRAFGAMMAMGMVDGMVEGFLTPEAISAMILQQKKNAKGKPVETEAPAEPEWAINRTGISSFELVAEKDSENSPALLFHRDGLGWKLIGIDLKGQSLSGNPMADAAAEAEAE